MDQARGGTSDHDPPNLWSAGADHLQDYPYLTEYIKEIETEMAEREDLEAMVITKRQSNANAGH